MVAWEKAVSYKPSHTAAWSNTLVLLDSTRKYDDVLRLGRKALMYNPKSPTLHFSIANTLGKMQQFEKAEKHFLEALHLSPLNALYYSNLGTPLFLYFVFTVIFCFLTYGLFYKNKSDLFLVSIVSHRYYDIICR